MFIRLSLASGATALGSVTRLVQKLKLAGATALNLLRFMVLLLFIKLTQAAN